jgi:hypothetical protein
VHTAPDRPKISFLDASATIFFRFGGTKEKMALDAFSKEDNTFRQISSDVLDVPAKFFYKI